MDGADFSSLRYETSGRTAYITLDRPERLNAIDGSMPGEIRRADSGRWIPEGGAT